MGGMTFYTGIAGLVIGQMIMAVGQVGTDIVMALKTGLGGHRGVILVALVTITLKWFMDKFTHGPLFIAAMGVMTSEAGAAHFNLEIMLLLQSALLVAGKTYLFTLFLQ